MTIDIDAIRQREQAAEPGPWRVVEEHGRDISDEAWSRVAIQSESGNRRDIAELIGDDVADGSALVSENAEFIAHARTDVPALVAEVRRLTAERDDARRLATLNAESQQATAQILAEERARTRETHR